MKGSLAGFVRSALLGVCLLLSAAGSVTAAETKPDIALKSKAAAISVTLDPKIKTNAKLAAYLMADGKKWANSNLAEANKQFRESPEFFSDGRTWEMERDYSLQSTVADRYVTSCAMNAPSPVGRIPIEGLRLFSGTIKPKADQHSSVLHGAEG